MTSKGYAFTRSLTSTIVMLISGCGSQAFAPNANGNQAVFVDSVTLQPFVVDTTQSPHVNPETGKRTLAPALYCNDCRKWYPVPPVDEVNRTPGASLCPLSGNQMTVNGMWPK